MKEVKEIQKQTTEIAKILKKEGYEAGVIALGKNTGVATSAFGTYDTIESLIRSAGDESDILVNVEVNVW